MSGNKILTAVKGMLAVLFGITALFYPGLTLIVLARLFGLFAVIGGIFVFIAAFRRADAKKHRIYWLLEGIFDFIAGILILGYPGISVTVFLVIVGIWALVSGILLLTYYFRLKKYGNARAGILSRSILSLLFGIVIVLNPFGSAAAMTSIMGLFILVYGIFAIVSGFRQR